MASLAAVGCGEEDPTSVGGTLLPGQAIRTIEVILDGSAYLLRDTSFSGYTEPFGSGYFLMANQASGTVDANTVARFTLPLAIAVVDSGGTLLPDSMPSFFAGRIVVQLDTLRSRGSPPATIGAYRITEPWDPSSATWAYRVDTTGVREPWSQPGARGGEVIDIGMWQAGSDTVVIPVDSATLAAWADTTSLAHGAVVVVEDAGLRVRASDIVLRADARSSIRDDTVVTVTIRPTDRTFIFNPALPLSAPDPQVGGNPAWRTYVEFREGIDTLTVACPQISADCRVRLDEVDITYASMLLVPRHPPAGFLPSDSAQLVSRLLLTSPSAPLPRSPLGQGIGVTRQFVQPSRFDPPDVDDTIEVPMTEYIRAVVADTALTQDRLTRWVAIHPGIEGSDFGIMAFEPMPRLRLVITIASELQLR